MVVLKGIGKVAGIAAVVVLVIVAVVGYMFVLPLVSSSPAVVLVVESGSVQLAQSPYRNITGEISISEGNKVKTSPGGRAKLVLFGGSEVRMDENTEISLQELKTQKDAKKITVKQESGRLWNKITKLSGMSEYNVETPTSVATVRGTGFESVVGPDRSTTGVVDGNVTLRSKLTGKTESIEENEEGEVDSNGDVSTDTLTLDGWISGNVQKDSAFIEGLKEKIKAKYGTYIGIAKSQYGLTDGQIDQYLDDAISGKYSQAEIKAVLDELGLDLTL